MGKDIENVLLVHYNDLKADFAGEMRRIADFLEIEVSTCLWPSLVESARFKTMRERGHALMVCIAQTFQGGGRHFFNKGVTGRWRGLFRAEDLALYDSKLAARLPSSCAR